MTSVEKKIKRFQNISSLIDWMSSALETGSHDVKAANGHPGKTLPKARVTSTVYKYDSRDTHTHTPSNTGLLPLISDGPHISFPAATNMTPPDRAACLPQEVASGQVRKVTDCAFLPPQGLRRRCRRRWDRADGEWNRVTMGGEVGSSGPGSGGFRESGTCRGSYGGLSCPTAMVCSKCTQGDKLKG